VIFPLILGLVLLSLVLLLRSVVAPVVLVGTVVLTFLAALGVSWWIFTKIFNFSALDVGTPLYAFLFLVALGVDYNIFLVTRAREETPAHGSREGMLRALAATGGVITSAASCSPRSSRSWACCRSSCWPRSVSSSASECCWTPSSCAPCSCRRSRSSSATGFWWPRRLPAAPEQTGALVTQGV
jgi:hypothetical protein